MSGREQIRREILATLARQCIWTVAMAVTVAPVGAGALGLGWNLLAAYLLGTVGGVVSVLLATWRETRKTRALRHAGQIPDSQPEDRRSSRSDERHGLPPPCHGNGDAASELDFAFEPHRPRT